MKETLSRESNIWTDSDVWVDVRRDRDKLIPNLPQFTSVSGVWPFLDFLTNDTRPYWWEKYTISCWLGIILVFGRNNC